MKKSIVIINPNSGRKKKIDFLDNIKTILFDYGYECSIFLTEYKGHAEKIVSKIEDIDLVISMGGDGTFNEVMRGNFKRKKRIVLAHLPLGTANDIGAMYGYGKNVLNNLKLLLEGKIKKIDICTINGIPFTYCAAFGKFTNVSYETPRKLKKQFGYLAYLIEGLKEMSGKTKLYPITYEVDNEEYQDKFSFILLSNANRIAGINNFYENVLLDDYRFEVLFCTLKDKKDIVKSLYHLTKNDITKVPGFKFYKVSSLKLKFKDKPTKGWCIDGEELEDKNDEYEIKIVKNVEILIPEKNIDKLFLNKE